MSWTNTKDAMPKSGLKVIASYVNRCGNRRTIIAVYFRKFECEGSADFDDIELEYCEQKDAYFYPAGWYEQIDNWVEYSSCTVHEGEIDFWQTLPKAP